MCSVLDMSDVALSGATLRDLHGDPGTPLLRLVSGVPDPQAPPVSISTPHLARLIQWAGITGLPDGTTVDLGGRLPGLGLHGHEAVRPGELLPSLGVDRLTRPPGEDPGTRGWALVLTVPGFEAERRDVDLLDTGVVHDRGSQADQSERWRRAEQRRVLAARELRERDDPSGALLDHLQRATRERALLQRRLSVKEDGEVVGGAEKEWRDAIKAVLTARDDRRLTVHVDDVARMAGVSRERLYQIRDNRR